LPRLSILKESALLTQLQPQAFSAEEGPAFWFLNTLSTVKASSESTGGSLSIVHHIAPPGFATPFHLHHVEDEAFYVLDGSVTFIAEGKKTIAVPGGYIFLPRGIPHGFRVDGSSPATMLIFAMPGTGFVGMMQEMGELAQERRLPSPSEPDMEKLTSLCAKYGIDILGPLPD
jgi:quercetin dioxygenase-like cupin family protein